MTTSHFRVIGLDMSIINSGYCIIDDTHDPIVNVGSVKTKSGTHDIERFDEIITQLLHIVIFNPKTDYVLIEDYARQTRKGNTLIRLCELCGSLKNHLFHCGFAAKNIWTCSPPTLKKFVTGKGVGEKSQILKEVYRKWGLNAVDDNQADAFALAKLCRELALYQAYPNYVCENKYEHECVISLIAQNNMPSSLQRKFTK